MPPIYPRPGVGAAVANDSLESLIGHVIDRVMGGTDADFDINVDCDEDHRLNCDSGLAELLIESVVRSAVREMPGGGELSIASVRCDDGRIEIEVADTGSDVQTRFQSRPLVAAKLNAELRWQNCPQGGGAVTIAFPKSVAASRSATSSNARAA